MTIRASLLWVLAFFSFMLVIGAALGVLSLRISNGTLAELKQSQELDDALGRVVLSGRAQRPEPRGLFQLRGHRAQRRPGDPADGGPGWRSRRPAAAGEGLLNKGQAEYEYYKSPAADAAESLKEIEESYSILIQQGLNPLAATLEKGDMPGYQTQVQMVQDTLEGRFARAIEGFDFWRASKTLDAFEVAQVRYQFVLIAVSAGGVIAALLVFATYVPAPPRAAAAAGSRPPFRSHRRR